MPRNNYEISFIKNNEIIRFQSTSLDEIKAINQILIDINYDISTLKHQKHFVIDNVSYYINYSKGVLKIVDIVDENIQYLNEPMLLADYNMSQDIEIPSSVKNQMYSNEDKLTIRKNIISKDSLTFKEDTTYNKRYADSNVIKLSSYVKSSSYRLDIIHQLHNSMKTPKEIAISSGLRPNNVSKSLSDLKDKGVVYCMNEEVRKGRLYKLTDLGEEIFDYLTGL